MEYAQFIERVQQYAELDRTEQVRDLSRAVLETLGEALERTERRHLGTELPRELQGFLNRQKHSAAATIPGPAFSEEEFFNRVISRGAINRREAVRDTRAVMHAIRDAISDGEFQDIFEQLQHYYPKLFA